MLDEHSKVHGNYMQSTAGPTLTGSPHNHYFDFGNPANNFIGPWIPAFTPASIPVDGQNSYTVVGADAAEPSLPASPQGTTPSTASSPTGRLLCSYPGCHTKCARAGDLRRHALKHQTGPKAFECPNPGCPRKGLHAFARKDKMLSHAKVCRGGARGERSRA